MKYYKLVLLAFLLNISIASLNVLTTQSNLLNYQNTANDDWIDSVTDRSRLLNNTYGDTRLEDLADDPNESGNFRLGLSQLTEIFFYGTVGTYWMMLNLGLHPELAILFAAPFYLIYAIALIQFFSNRGFKGME